MNVNLNLTTHKVVAPALTMTKAPAQKVAHKINKSVKATEMLIKMSRKNLSMPVLQDGVQHF